MYQRQSVAAANPLVSNDVDENAEMIDADHTIHGQDCRRRSLVLASSSLDVSQLRIGDKILVGRRKCKVWFALLVVEHGAFGDNSIHQQQRPANDAMHTLNGPRFTVSFKVTARREIERQKTRKQGRERRMRVARMCFALLPSELCCLRRVHPSRKPRTYRPLCTYARSFRRPPHATTFDQRRPRCQLYPIGNVSRACSRTEAWATHLRGIQVDPLDERLMCIVQSAEAAAVNDLTGPGQNTQPTHTPPVFTHTPPVFIGVHCRDGSTCAPASWFRHVQHPEECSPLNVPVRPEGADPAAP
jgi:hypothetical protein